MSDDASPANLHQIGTVEDRVGLSQRTIRHYDEIGLVTPSGRSRGGFRLYTDDDIARLIHIKAMKQLGFSLEGHGELLEIRDRLEAGGALSPATLATLRESAERASQRCVKLERQLNEARALTKVMWDQVVLGESRLKPAADAS